MLAISIISLVVSALVLIWTIVSFFLLNKQKKNIINLEKRLESINHISNRRFDLELTLYKELSNQSTKVQKNVSILFPIFDDSKFALTKGEEKNKIAHEMYNQTVTEVNALLDMIYSNEAFIDAELYIKFDNLLELSKEQMVIFKDVYLRGFENMLKVHEKSTGKNVYDSYDSIKELRKEISNSIKERLNFLVDN